MVYSRPSQEEVIFDFHSEREFRKRRRRCSSKIVWFVALGLGLVMVFVFFAIGLSRRNTGIESEEKAHDELPTRFDLQKGPRINGTGTTPFPGQNTSTTEKRTSETTLNVPEFYGDPMTLPGLNFSSNNITEWEQYPGGKSLYGRRRKNDKFGYVSAKGKKTAYRIKIPQKTQFSKMTLHVSRICKESWCCTVDLTKNSSTGKYEVLMSQDIGCYHVLAVERQGHFTELRVDLSCGDQPNLHRFGELHLTRTIDFTHRPEYFLSDISTFVEGKSVSYLTRHGYRSVSRWSDMTAKNRFKKIVPVPDQYEIERILFEESDRQGTDEDQFEPRRFLLIDNKCRIVNQNGDYAMAVGFGLHSHEWPDLNVCREDVPAPYKFCYITTYNI